MTAINIKMPGHYMACSNPEKKISKLIEHYLSIYHKGNDRVEALVICPKGLTSVGYELLGF